MAQVLRSDLLLDGEHGHFDQVHDCVSAHAVHHQGGSDHVPAARCVSWWAQAGFRASREPGYVLSPFRIARRAVLGQGISMHIRPEREMDRRSPGQNKFSEQTPARSCWLWSKVSVPTPAKRHMRLQRTSGDQRSSASFGGANKNRGSRSAGPKSPAGPSASRREMPSGCRPHA